MKPLISIIVPVYNAELYVAGCLESIIRQSYVNIEIIVIDDGSKDTSGYICDQYAKKDSRICVIHRANEGLVSARKLGVKLAKGDYIGFVDSDDWIEEQMYERLMMFSEDDVDLICCSFFCVKNNKMSKQVNSVRDGVYEGSALLDIYGNMMFDFERGFPGIMQSVCTKLFRASILKKVIIEIDNRLTLGEDAALVYSFCLNIKKIAVTNRAYYYYRILDNSMCGSKDFKRLEQIGLFYSFMVNVYKNFPIEYGLQRQLRMYLIYFLEMELSLLFGITLNRIYEIPQQIVSAYKNIVLYGAGKVGQSCYRRLSNRDKERIIAWIDLEHAGERVEGFLISTSSILAEIDYDIIFIAIKDENLALDIKNDLKKQGVGEDKILWYPPQERIMEREISI